MILLSLGKIFWKQRKYLQMNSYQLKNSQKLFIGILKQIVYHLLKQLAFQASIQLWLLHVLAVCRSFQSQMEHQLDWHFRYQRRTKRKIILNDYTIKSYNTVNLKLFGSYWKYQRWLLLSMKPPILKIL